MHWLALRLMILGLAAFVALCGVGAVRTWARQGQDLIVPGAEQVRIERTSLLRIHATYRLAAGQTVHTALQFLRTQGWRTIRSTVAEPGTIVLVRIEWSGRIRDVMFLTPDRDDRRRIDLQFGRCFRAQWIQCI